MSTSLLAIAVMLATVATIGILWFFLWLISLQSLLRKSVDETGTCPMCGSKDIRGSHIHGTIDRIRHMVGLSPYRCRACLRRFFSRTSSGQPSLAEPSAN